MQSLKDLGRQQVQNAKTNKHNIETSYESFKCFCFFMGEKYENLMQKLVTLFSKVPLVNASKCIQYTVIGNAFVTVFINLC